MTTNPVDLAEVELNTASDGAPSEQEIAIRTGRLAASRTRTESSEKLEFLGRRRNSPSSDGDGPAGLGTPVALLATLLPVQSLHGTPSQRCTSGCSIAKCSEVSMRPVANLQSPALPARSAGPALGYCLQLALELGPRGD